MSALRWTAVVVGVALVGALIATRSCDDAESPPAPRDSAPTTHATAPRDGLTGARSGAPRGRRARDASPDDKTTGVSIETVDETGASVGGGTAYLAFADPDQSDAPGADAVAEIVARPIKTTAGAPVKYLLPRDAAGIRVRAYGQVFRGTPAEPVEATIRAGEFATLRLVGTEEARARQAYVPPAVKPRKSGACTIRAKVVGPNGVPVSGVRVRLAGVDRDARTDAAGRVAFADVTPEAVLVLLDSSDWSRAAESAAWPSKAPHGTALVDARDGGTYDVVLGAAPEGTARIEARLVGEDARPIAGVRVELGDIEGAAGSCVTDYAGNAQFARLPPGIYFAHVQFGKSESCDFGHFQLAEGEETRPTWTIGDLTVRGRVVAGGDRHAAGGVDVAFYMGEPSARTATTTDADGSFALRHARRGTNFVIARTRGAGFDGYVAIPAERDVVIELIEFGKVVVRIAASDRRVLGDAEASLEPTDDRGHLAFATRDRKSGDLVADEVFPGRYDVVVQVDGRTRRAPVEVKSGATATVEIQSP